VYGFAARREAGDEIFILSLEQIVTGCDGVVRIAENDPIHDRMTDRKE
jgi:hypothetical protein